MGAASKARYLGRAKQKGWSTRRLVGYYESGGDMAEFRGHGGTPERPERAFRHLERYGGYVRRGGRTVTVIAKDGGVRAVEHLSKAERSTVARHWNAAKRYVTAGDDAALGRFEGVEVNGVELETRTNALDWLAMRHDLDFESIYPDSYNIVAA